MLEIKTFRCEVDLYRNGMVFRDFKNRLYERQSQGVYYVGAKSAKEAKELLQEKIRFGSITVPKRGQYVPDEYQGLAYKEIRKFKPKIKSNNDDNQEKEDHNDHDRKFRKQKHR